MTLVAFVPMSTDVAMAQAVTSPDGPPKDVVLTSGSQRTTGDLSVGIDGDVEQGSAVLAAMAVIQ